jgi:hypothetical protein
LIVVAVAIYYAISVSPFYQQQVNLINFTATSMAYTYVPEGAEIPTGEAAAGAGSGFGLTEEVFLYLRMYGGSVPRNLKNRCDTPGR